jgi:hypothetical protein
MVCFDKPISKLMGYKWRKKLAKTFVPKKKERGQFSLSLLRGA